MKQRFQLLLAMTAIALAIILGACTGEESTVTGPDGSALSPLSSDFFPLAVGNWWEFVRAESGVFSPDTTLDYYDQDLPGAYTRWDCVEGGAESDLILQGLTTSGPDGGGVVEHYLDLWIDQAGSGFEFVGEDTLAATDSSVVFLDAAPYGWIRFGQLRWEHEIADYSFDSLSVNYDGDEQGMVDLNEALGFDFERMIYDGSSQPGNIPWDPSDVDYDTYLDGIRKVRFVAEVIAEEDFAYGDFGAAADSLFPELVGVEFQGCRWVRFSLEADIFLSNQRDPNSEPGQSAIPEEYIANRSRDDLARLDLGMLLLSPEVGPVIVVTYADLDKQLKVGDYEDDSVVFQPDLTQYDFLVDSNLMP